MVVVLQQFLIRPASLHYLGVAQLTNPDGCKEPPPQETGKIGRERVSLESSSNQIQCYFGGCIVKFEVEATSKVMSLKYVKL